MIRTKRIHLTPAATRCILQREARRLPVLRLFTGVAIAATAAAALYDLAYDSNFAMLRAWLPLLGCAGLWWVFFLWLSPWLFTRSKRFPLLAGPMVLAFSPEAIRQEHADGSTTEVSLAGARTALRADHAIVYGRRATMIVVPFDAFETPADAAQVRQWLGATAVTTS